MQHLERFGFTWENSAIEFKYSVELSTDKKVIKKYRKITRKKLSEDELRITSIELDKTKPESSNNFTRRSQLFAYFWNKPIMKEWHKELKSSTRVVFLEQITFLFQNFTTIRNVKIG